MTKKIGVYICECGPNIKDAVDIDELMRFAQNLENVVLVRSFGVLCSGEGQELIGKEIEAHQLNRIVVAACSPKEHEVTFNKVLKKSGLNPFLLQIANIREQCSWVIKDKVVATEKAKVIIKAAVERVIYHEPLETREIECQSDVLVLGAGVAGMSAALTLAQKNRRVYLVERLPFIGGKVVRYERVFPSLECASCLIDPVQDEVLHHERIEVLTLSQVTEVLGFYGNFIVKLKKYARFVDMTSCIGCGACFEVCPVRVKNEYNEGLDERRAIYIPFAGILPHVAVIDKERCLHFNGEDCEACRQVCPFGSIDYRATDQVQELHVGAIVLATGFDIFDPIKAPQYGYGRIENVYTSFEFERLLSSTGPTGGRILLKNGTVPQRIALVHCVGSKSSKFNEYCSGVCCMYSLKFAHLIKMNSPDVSITELYSDFCLPGKESQHFFNRLSGVEFFCMKDPDSIQIDEKDGKILIEYIDFLGKTETVTSDMVVLACAIEGAEDAPDLARIFRLSQDRGGFFIEENTSLAPVSTSTDGIFIAGCVQAPLDIQSAVAQGQAAAGRILSRLLSDEKLIIEAMTAEVDEALCSGCKICVGLCPYKAISLNDGEELITVNEVLCRGCGICAAACPSSAIRSRHFTDEQMYAELGGIIHEKF